MIDKTVSHYRVRELPDRGGWGNIHLADDLNLK